MSDNTKALEEYYRLLAEMLRLLEELSMKWWRLALLKSDGQENPIEVFSSKEDPEEDLEEDPEEDMEDDPKEEPEDYLE